MNCKPIACRKDGTRLSRSMGSLFVTRFFLVVLALAMTGCTEQTDTLEVQRGHLIHLYGNDQVQLEVFADGKQRKFFVNVLESDSGLHYPVVSEKLGITFTVSGQEIDVTLDANPRPSDPEGRASRFAIDFDEIPERLHDAADYTARFTVEIQGSMVTGTLQHTDDHDHSIHHD